MPKISIVTPVYNAAQNLQSLYGILCKQQFTEWEWVVVDDGSTDESGKILDKIGAEDPRVRVFHQSNSGSAKMPRDRAVYESKTDFVMQIDADDIIDDNYLETIVKRQQETDADIVYPRMYFIRDGKTQRVLPLDEIDTTKVYSGQEALVMTIPEWRIGCAGGIYKKKVWVNMSYPSYNGNNIYMNSDEVDERLYLLEAKKVAFCTSQYRYILHPESITNSIKLNRFDTLDTDLALLDIIKDACGRNSEAFGRAQQKVFYGFRSAMRFFMEHYDDFAEHRKLITDKLRHTFDRLSGVKMTTKERVEFLNLSSFSFVMYMSSLKYRGIKGLRLKVIG